MKLLHYTSFFLFTVLLLSSPMKSWSQAFFPAYQGGLNALKKKLENYFEALNCKEITLAFSTTKK